jgi:hypothetical protein
VPNRGCELSKKNRPESGGIDLQIAVQLWPTIQIADAKQAKYNKRGNPHLGRVFQYPTPNVRDCKNPGLNYRKDKLNDFPLDRDSPSTNGKSRELWATPNTADSVGTHGGGQSKSLRTDIKNWSTPEAEHQKGYHNQKDGTSIEKLGTQAGKGKLNPDWVEQLMGLTVGWTDLGYWETE